MTGIVLQGIVMGLVLTIAVGPVVFAALNISMRLGHAPGYAFVLGVSFSDVVLVVLGNLAAEYLRQVLKYEKQIALVGALLLIGIGLYSLLFGKDARDETTKELLTFSRRDLARFSLQGFLMNTLNPGSLAFWLSTCTAYAFMPLNQRVILFGSCLFMVLLLDLMKVYFSGWVRQFLTPRALHLIHLTTACLLVGIGVVLGLYQLAT